MLLGRHQQTTARPSLIVTGPAAAGKTTALLEVGRTCHLAHTRKNPLPPGRAQSQVPVAYVLVPPGATAKTLATEFARYLGIPTTTRRTQAQITSAVCHTYTAVGVRLVLIDEIHRLNPRTTTGAEAADLRPERHDADVKKKTTDSPAGEEEFAALCSRAWDVLIPARADYLADVSSHYDEVFREVAQRTETAGNLGKTDIAALVVWKRLSAQTRWVTELMSLPETKVREITKQAVTKVRDTTLSRGEAAHTGRAIISELPGFHTGDALASAVLTAAGPQRMAVYDRRVQHALDGLGLTLTPAPGRYGRYMQLLDDLLHHGEPRADGWTARDIDTALYWTGHIPHQPAPA